MAQKILGNDSEKDEIRNLFNDAIPEFDFYSLRKKVIPYQYLYQNVHEYPRKEIYKEKNNIVVGEYCNHGVVVPRDFSISFSKLYNCSPLISLIKSDEKEYISFLHTWAVTGNKYIVDKQVRHWMGTVSEIGDVSETIFAPRLSRMFGVKETEYETAVDEIKKVSQETTIVKREISEIVGITNSKGVYFKGLGYKLWNR